MNTTRFNPKFILFSIIALCFSASIESLQAAILNPEDILVTGVTEVAPGVSISKLYMINHETAEQTEISSGGFLVNTTAVGVSPDGTLYVVEASGSGSVIKIDPVTGIQTIVSSGGYFSYPRGIAFATNGDILIVDLTTQTNGAVIRVDPLSGSQELITTNSLFRSPVGIAVFPSGVIIVSDVNAYGTSPYNYPSIAGGALFRVDQENGAQSLISKDTYFFDPGFVGIEPSGDLVVADYNSFSGGVTGCGGGKGAIIRVNPITGAQTIVTIGGPISGCGLTNQNFPPNAGIAVSTNGIIYWGAVGIACTNSPGAIIRVDTAGVKTVFAYGSMGRVSNIALIPPDIIPPVATITAPIDATFIRGTSLTITGTAEDVGAIQSGIAEVEVSTDGGENWGTATGTNNWSYTWTLPVDGTYDLLVRAKDSANNLQTTPASVTVIVDNTPPNVTLVSPPNGAIYTLNQVVTTDYSCNDSGSGIADCEGPISSGSYLDTGTIGPKSFTVQSHDQAGNNMSTTHNYTVQYQFSDFLMPVDKFPTMNVVKAGSIIPVKWQLMSASGNYIPNLSTFVSLLAAPMTCGTGQVDDIEEVVTTPGNTVFRYDSAVNQFIYNWKTVKGSTGCIQLKLTLDDGNKYYANFKFK